RSTLAAATSPSRARASSAWAMAATSSGRTLSIRACRKAATLRAKGLPGPPRLPAAKRPRWSRPSGVAGGEGAAVAGMGFSDRTGPMKREEGLAGRDDRSSLYYYYTPVHQGDEDPAGANSQRQRASTGLLFRRGNGIGVANDATS